MRTTLFRLILTLQLVGASPACLAAPPVGAENGISPGSVSISRSSITYVTRQGDTLSSIALQFTSRQENWLALAKLNGIDKDRGIPIGSNIIIPAELLADEPSEAVVVALSGDVTTKKSDGSKTTLGIGTKILEGMEVDTGGNSFLTLALPDTSRITLPSNSMVKIFKLRVTRYTKSPRTELMLLGGHVESRVAPLESNKGRFEVRTSKSVAGVRGTHFRVGITENGVANEVLSGKVAVGNARDADTLMLPTGKGNLINAQAVGPAVDLLPAPQLLGHSAEKIYASLQFPLSPVPGAIRYHVQVASDQDTQNILAENTSANSTVTVNPLANGNYYVRVSAIDKAGLEGFPQTHAFTLMARAESSAGKAPGASSAPFVDQSNASEITLKWLPQPGKKFLLQVARDAEFSWLLFKTDTPRAEAHLPRPAFGTYYARVKSVNSDGSDNAFSPVQAFIVTDQWVINDGSPVGGQQTVPSATR